MVFPYLTEIIGSFQKEKQKYYQFKGKFWEDEHEFPLGYNQSFCLVIFVNCLLFSIIVPVIPFFATIYFHIKYYVDKNNLIFNYCKKYESGGQIRSSTRNFMIFNLYFYMIVTTAFFAHRLPNNGILKYLGFVMILVWTFVLWLLLKESPHKMKKLIAAALHTQVLVQEDKILSENEKQAIEKANLKVLRESYKTPVF